MKIPIFLACSPETAVVEWLMSKAIYERQTGRTQSRKLSHLFAKEYTKGENAFIVATHTDREYINNHIEFNSTKIAVMVSLDALV